MEPARPEEVSLPAPPVDEPSTYVWSAHRKFQDRVWLHLLLFLATVASTMLVGMGQYASFVAETTGAIRLSPFELLVRGGWYSATILAILGCHELGHYLACRYYDVDASLPYFLPLPIALTGTLGAFIRIREPIPSKRMLFDIGIAGPIAGFVIAVPALLVGLAMSRVVPMPAEFHGYSLGEPLLFKLASWMFFGSPPDGYYVSMHPMAFAAWFGLLATALNLFPIGQLDGGHISYAVLGLRSTLVTLVMLGVAVMLAIFMSVSWVVWTILLIVMLVTFGPRHPRTIDEHIPLDRTRLALALFALIMFIVCFTPAPIEPLDLIRH